MAKVEVRLHPRNPQSMEQRIRRRLYPSNDGMTADTKTVQGSPDHPQRVVHTNHFSGNQRQHGEGEGGAR